MMLRDKLFAARRVVGARVPFGSLGECGPIEDDESGGHVGGRGDAGVKQVGLHSDAVELARGAGNSTAAEELEVPVRRHRQAERDAKDENAKP